MFNSFLLYNTRLQIIGWVTCVTTPNSSRRRILDPSFVLNTMRTFKNQCATRAWDMGYRLVLGADMLNRSRRGSHVDRNMRLFLNVKDHINISLDVIYRAVSEQYFSWQMEIVCDIAILFTYYWCKRVDKTQHVSTSISFEHKSAKKLRVAKGGFTCVPEIVWTDPSCID